MNKTSPCIRFWNKKYRGERITKSKTNQLFLKTLISHIMDTFAFWLKRSILTLKIPWVGWKLIRDKLILKSDVVAILFGITNLNMTSESVKSLLQFTHSWYLIKNMQLPFRRIYQSHPILKNHFYKNDNFRKNRQRGTSQHWQRRLFWPWRKRPNP